MSRKVLFTASTESHIRHFHLPYLKHFRERGWTVHVGCGDVHGEIPCANELVELPFEKKMTAPGNFRAAKQLKAKIKAEGYDLICTHTSLAAFFTRLALVGLKERPKVVNMVHGYLFDDQTNWTKWQILLAAERLVAGYTDLLLTMNRYDLEIAQRYRLGEQIHNIPGVGVDFSRFDAVEDGTREELRRELGIPEDAFVLLYAAEFSGRKSQSDLIRAMTQLPEHAVLILAGNGALWERCRHEAKELGVDGRVIFPGYIKDMPRWYRMADAVVTSSRSEGLPFNVMEAMYSGLPVVASAVKGHEDLIEHGETGLLYPYGDADACAQQISALIEDPGLCATLGRQAKEAVMGYSLEQVLPLVTEQYESLLPADAAQTE